MKLLRLSLNGFGSWTEPADIDLSTARMIAVTGHNGAGKSTIFSAIRWLLYGEGTTEAVIPDGADEASAKLVFEADGDEWHVTRSRNRNGKTQAHLSRQLDGGGKEQVAYGVTGVNKAMEDVLRIGRVAFEASVFHRQGDPGAFAPARPGDRKAILTEIIGLSKFENLAAIARANQRAAETKAKTLDDQGEALAARARNMRADTDSAKWTGRVRESAERLAEARTRLAGAIEAQKRSIEAAKEMAHLRDEMEAATKAHEQALAAASRRRTEVEADLASAKRDVATAVAQAKQAQARINRAIEAKSHLEALQADWAAATKQSASIASKLSGAEAKLFALEAQRDTDMARLAALESGRSRACFTCERPFASGERELLATRLRRQIDDTDLRVQRGWSVVEGARQEQHQTESEKRSLESAIESARSAAVGATDAAASLAQAEGALATAETRCATLTERLDNLPVIGPDARIAALRAALDTASRNSGWHNDREVAEAEGVVARFEADNHRATAQLARCKEALSVADALEAEGAQATEQAATERETAEVERLLAKAFSTSGIPHLIYGSIVAELNAHANEVMYEMSSEMEVRLDSDATPGGLEVFVDLPDGHRRQYQMLSGGEKTRVDLALGVALSLLVGNRSGEPLRLFAFDEGWGALDGAGVNATLAALRRVSHHFDLILSVSHHPDAIEGFDARLEVTRDESGSHCELVWN